MKLTVFNAETLNKRNGSSIPPRISFGKNGAIGLNRKATELLGLKDGDKVALAQNPESPEDWYFYQDPKGYEVRGKDEQGVVFNHQALRLSFINAFDLATDQTWSFEISTEPLTFKNDKNKYYFIKVVVPESETAVD